MAAERRVDSTADLRDLDASTRVAGRFLRHDGTKFVGDADVASAADLTALDAAIDDLAADLAAETAARQVADTALTTAVAGKAPLTHTHTTSQITDLGSWPGSTALVTLGTVTTGTWHGTVIGPDYLGTGTRDGTKYLRDDGTWQAVASGADLAIGADVTDGTADSVLYLTAGGVLAQRNPGFTYNGSTLKLRADGSANILEWGSSETPFGAIRSNGFLNIGPQPSANAYHLCILSGSGYALFSIGDTAPKFHFGYAAAAAQFFPDALAGDTNIRNDGFGTWIRIGVDSTGAGTVPSMLRVSNSTVNVVANTPGVVPFTVKGATSQSVNLQEWLTGADIWRVAVTPGYALALGDLSSTTQRQQALIAGVWSIPTDASRLGELVLSSSGYNGDHVGLRVRDNGSGADLIADNMREAADDTAAAALSPPVPLNAVYRTGSTLKIRVS
jgi:hypothetical protein